MRSCALFYRKKLAGNSPYRCDDNQCRNRLTFVKHMMLTDGQQYPSNKYFGRIDGDGGLNAGKDLNDSVKQLVYALANEPAKVAEVYGKKTGSCCFCNTKLTDGKSVAVGYGPVCAKNFGLVWGKEKVEVDVAVSLN